MGSQRQLIGRSRTSQLRLALLASGLLLALLPAPHPMAAQGTPRPVSCALPAIPVQAATPAPANVALSSRRQAVIATAELLLACRNASNWETVAELIQPELLDTWLGIREQDDPATSLKVLSDRGFLPPVQLISIGEPVTSALAGSLSLTFQEGMVLRQQEWQMRLVHGFWRLAGMTDLPPLLTTTTAGIPFTLSQSSLSSTRTELVDPGAIAFDLVNATPQHASFVVLRLGAGSGELGSTGILQQRDFPAEQVVAWQLVPAAETRTVVLVDPPAGNYLIVARYDPRLGEQAVDPGYTVQVTITES